MARSTVENAAVKPSRYMPAARQSRRVPASWRIFVLVLAMAVCARISIYLVLALSILAMIPVWQLLAPNASPQIENNTSRGINGGFAFLAGLTTLSGLLILAIEPIGYILRDSPDRQTTLILLAVIGLIFISTVMCSQGWRIGSALLVGIAVFASLTAGVWYSTAQTEGEIGYGRTFFRLLLIGGAAEFLTPVAFRGDRMLLKVAWDSILRYLTLLLMLALVQQLASQPEALGWWNLSTILTGVVVAWLVWLARAPAYRDLCWWTGRRPNEAMPAPILTSLGFVPAIGLTDVANWPVWMLVFGLGVTTGFLANLGRFRWRMPATASKPLALSPA